MSNTGVIYEGPHGITFNINKAAKTNKENSLVRLFMNGSYRAKSILHVIYPNLPAKERKKPPPFDVGEGFAFPIVPEFQTLIISCSLFFVSSSILAINAFVSFCTSSRPRFSSSSETSFSFSIFFNASFEA